MKQARIEFDFVPPSANKRDRMNRFVLTREKKRYERLIRAQIGEGPYPKSRFKKGTPQVVRCMTMLALRSRWPKKRKCLIEISARLKRRFDEDNYAYAYKDIVDALQWAGWMVSDHVSRLRRIYRDQVLGDPHTIIEVWVPETDEEESELERRK